MIDYELYKEMAHPNCQYAIVLSDRLPPEWVKSNLRQHFTSDKPVRFGPLYNMFQVREGGYLYHFRDEENKVMVKKLLPEKVITDDPYKAEADKPKASGSQFPLIPWLLAAISTAVGGIGWLLFLFS